MVCSGAGPSRVRGKGSRGQTGGGAGPGLQGRGPRGGAGPAADRRQQRRGAMAAGEPEAGGRALRAAQAEDVASASSFRSFELLHLHLDLRAEFGPPGPGPGSRGLSGSAVLDLRCRAPGGAAELRLDSHPCVDVTAAALRRGRPEPGRPEPEPEPVSVCAQPFSHYGQALCLHFPQPCAAGELLQVRITYRVGEGPGVSTRSPRASSCRRASTASPPLAPPRPGDSPPRASGPAGLQPDASAPSPPSLAPCVLQAGQQTVPELSLGLSVRPAWAGPWWCSARGQP